MRIHDAYTKQDRAVRAEGPLKNREAGARAPDIRGSGATGGASDATNVIVSARAKELLATAQPSGARVDALRAQIKNGTFKVDAQSIAHALVGASES
jgi:flagellar biosynthesis anti-sigma factor FlgM